MENQWRGSAATHVEAGAFSFVYKINDTVAVKVIRPPIADERHLKSLRREGLIGKQAHLKDPVHFAEVYEEREDFESEEVENDRVTVIRHKVALVMEWVQGQTLQASINQKEKLDQGAVLYLGMHIAEGLKSLYSVGHVHRDVKPANIMISRNHTAISAVKLIDLGCAHSLGYEDSDSEDRVVGTPSYSAIETIVNNVQSSPRADLYSLGAVLYEAASGEIYNPCSSFQERVMHDLQRLAQKSDPPSHKLSQHSKGTRELIDALLEMDYQRRPQSPDEVISRIRQLI